MKVLFVSLAIVIIDQVTKLLVKGFSIPFFNLKYSGMMPGQRIPIIGDFFRLNFIENPGMAFGFDPGLNYKFYISVFSLVASVGLVVYLYFIRKERLGYRIAIAFILGGAVGNLIDRMFYGVFYHYAPLFYGHVVDFFDVDFFNFSLFGRSYDRWPIFNVADAAVTIGVFLLLIFYNKREKVKVNETEEVLSFDPAKNEISDPESEEEKTVDNNSEIKSGKNEPGDGQSDNGKEISI